MYYSSMAFGPAVRRNLTRDEMIERARDLVTEAQDPKNEGSAAGSCLSAAKTLLVEAEAGFDDIGMTEQAFEQRLRKHTALSLRELIACARDRNFSDAQRASFRQDFVAFERTREIRASAAELGVDQRTYLEIQNWFHEFPEETPTVEPVPDSLS